MLGNNATTSHLPRDGWVTLLVEHSETAPRVTGWKNADFIEGREFVNSWCHILS